MSIGKIEDRIKKMKQAIHTEAKQRALHIVERAQQQADIERVNIIKEQKERIDSEYQKLHKAEKVKAKIEKSTAVNRQRIRKMEARHQMVQELKNELKNTLKTIANNQSKYKPLVTQLIVQGLLRMMERNVSIQGASEHKDLLTSVFGDCQKQFTNIVKSETGGDLSTTLRLSEYSLENKYQNPIGGIFLRSNDGLIVCDNSLDARVELIFEQLLPEIRQSLFAKSH